MIQRGEFREDLFYRLSVIPLHLPPLRDRGDDLELLVSSILDRLRATDGRARTLAPVAWAKLRGYSWPGNIRELDSVLRRAAILEETDELVLSDFVAPSTPVVSTPPTTRGDQSERLVTLDEHERAYIEHVLGVLGGVIEGASGAARVLGVPPSTLRSRMKRLGISLQRGKGRKPS
jgi:transcriptional regulator with GAF, ATPase, and Fis domain